VKWLLLSPSIARIVELLMKGKQLFVLPAAMLWKLAERSLPTTSLPGHSLQVTCWVMDFIAGETLEDHLAKAKGGYLPVKKALAIGIQLCTVLDYLHTRQPPIIFRDLKPGNVMCLPDGQLYLIDFGIARHFKPGQSKDTASFGSAGYAAPEQYGKAQTTVTAIRYSPWPGRLTARDRPRSGQTVSVSQSSLGLTCLFAYSKVDFAESRMLYYPQHKKEAGQTATHPH
jgi:serine/threonine protein kinase